MPKNFKMLTPIKSGQIPNNLVTPEAEVRYYLQPLENLEGDRSSTEYRNISTDIKKFLLDSEFYLTRRNQNSKYCAKDCQSLA